MADPAVTASTDPEDDEGLVFAHAAWNTLADLKVVPLPDFLKNADTLILTADEQAVILEEAKFLIKDLYPHLPFKQELFSTARPLELLEKANESTSQRAWHECVILGISSVLDAHTLYGVPAPYAGAVAFLPFQMDVYWDRNHIPHFAVTAVIKTSFTGTSFGPGAEILTWDGHGILEYVTGSRGGVPSGNFSATIKRQTILATVRPLRYCDTMKLEERATLRYVPDGGGDAREIRLPWGVAPDMGESAFLPGNAFSFNAVTESAHAVHRALGHLTSGHAQPDATAPSQGEVSRLPDVFEFQYTRGTPRQGLPHPERLYSAAKPDGRFGYIRIKTFSHDQLGEALLEEFGRILRDVMSEEASDGLLIDIRANPGGDIRLAEQLLQMLGPGPITPLDFHLANTPAVRRVLQDLKTPDFSQLTTAGILTLAGLRHDMKPWIDDLDNFDPNSVLSPGHPLTSPILANSIGRIYHGKCALLVDALSYSAADIFAAGFEDNQIGPVIGADLTTGGGGAEVWDHNELARNLTAIPSVPNRTPLPKGARLSLAIRRAYRVRKNAGIAIEDCGVKADVYFAAGSMDELLSGSQTIVEFACDHLSNPQETQLTIRRAVQTGQQLEIEIETRNLDLVLISVNHYSCGSVELTGGSIQKLRVDVPQQCSSPLRLSVSGSYFYPVGSTENLVYGPYEVTEV